MATIGPGSVLLIRIIRTMLCLSRSVFLPEASQLLISRWWWEAYLPEPARAVIQNWDMTA